MTQVLDMPLPDSRASEQKLVLGVCFAHFVSHYYITLLAPLFVFIKEDYAVSYTDLGLAFTALLDQDLGKSTHLYSIHKSRRPLIQQSAMPPL